MSVKKINLDVRYGSPSDYLGKFLDDSNYDHLIDYDCDVYGPRSLGQEEDNENNLILKFRKGVFSKELCEQTYENIRGAAQQSQNRGLAAGPRGEKLEGRDWVTNEQEDILEAFSNATEGTLVEKKLVYTGAKDEEATRGRVWLSDKVKKNKFDFRTWFEETLKLSPEQKVEAAEFVKKNYISMTTYANPVFSGIAGYFDRYPRIPYCRATAYTAKNFDKWQKCIPFIEGVSEQFKLLTPGRYEAQKLECDKLDPEFIIGNSAYTTVTVNKNYRTAAHRDAGDLTKGFGNLTVVSNGVDYNGSYLVFPEFRVAVDVRPGDMLAMQIHEIHGNTPMVSEKGDHERISIVCYFREGMVNCKSKKYEELRFQFVEERRLNKNHEEWRPGWNGISVGLWHSQEWAEYLAANGMVDEDGLVSIEENTLGGLFE